MARVSLRLASSLSLVLLVAACGGPKVQSIEVTPTGATIASGAAQQFKAMAHYSDKTQLDVSSAAAWNTSDSSVIAFDAEATKGLAHARNPGSANVSALFLGVTGKAPITVTGPTQTALTIDPAAIALAAGTTGQLHATATLSNGGTQDVTGSATWTSSAAYATVDATGLVHAAAVGTATITATLGTLTATATVTVTNATLQSMSISPASPSVYKGGTLQLTATGSFSDGTTQDLTSSATWSSNNSTVAAFLGVKGLVTGVATGSVPVSAAVGSVNAVVTLSVTPAVISSIAVAPSVTSIALGTNTTLAATATLSDGSTEDVTTTATWTSSSAAGASVSAAGVVQALAIGTYTITAAISDVSGTASVTVTPATLTHLDVTPADPTLPVGGTLALTATGTFSDGSSQNLTSVAIWTSDRPTVATFPLTLPTGTVSALGVGTAVLSANVMGQSASVTATVTDAEVTALSVTPEFSTIALGTTVQLKATATLSDGASRDVSATATWHVGTGATITVSPSGLVQGTAVGQSDVTVTFGGQTATATISVTNAALLSVALSPENVMLPAGETVQLTATGSFSDGTTQDLSSSAAWSSSDTTILSVTGGLVKGEGQGTAVVTATVLGISGSLGVTVTAPEVTALEITPAFVTLARGTSRQLTATATFSDGTTQDVSSSASWEALTPDGISVSATGLVQTDATGDFVIGAGFGNASAIAQVTVTAAELTGLTIQPSTPSVAVGLTTGLSVIGTFTDTSTQDLTSGAVWVSGSPLIADFRDGSAAGVITGLAEGSTQVTVTVLGSSATTTVTVTPAELVSIAVQPEFVTLALGTSKQLSVSALYTNGSTYDVTADVQWDVGAAGGVTVDAGGLLTATAVGVTSVTATYGGQTASSFVTVTNASLVTLAIGPAGATAPVGKTVQLTATGTFTDGTSQDLSSSVVWVSSSESVLTVAGGLVTGVSVGNAVVSASLMGVSAQLDISITQAVVVSVSISPALSTLALGTTGQLSATATYSDGHTQDVTSLAQWQVPSGHGVSVSTAGLVRALAVGSTDVSATYAGVSSSATVAVTAATLVSIVVAPASSSIPVGTAVQLTATGTFTDGSTQNITSGAVWSSSDSSVATVDAGRVVAVAGGNVQISAALSGQTGKASVTVTTAILSSIAITPAAPVAAVGTTVQFSATGTYSDGSTVDVTSVATWSSDDTDIADFSATTIGLASAFAAGSATVTATVGSVSGSVRLTVTDAVLSSLTLSSSSLTLARGTSARLTVTGTYTDGSVRDLTSLATWASSDDVVARVDNAQGSQGLVTGLNAGSASVTAAVGGKTSPAAVVTVSDAELLSIEITPSNAVVPVGVDVNFTAIGTFTDLTTQDLTAQVSWTTSPSDIATFGAPGTPFASQATGVAAGSTVVTASLNGISGTATLNVSSAELVALAITPASASLAKGTSQQFVATGTYSDDSTADVTSLVTWSSSDGAVASVSNAQGSRGLATALAVGSADVQVTLQGVTSDVATVTVTAPVLTNIALTPSFVAVPNGKSRTFTATGTYSDGVRVDVTAQATWAISDSSVGTLTASGASVSVQAVASTGSATVSATLDGVKGIATFTAVDPVLTSLSIEGGSSSIIHGRSAQFVATGSFSDGSSRDLTSSAIWTSDDTDVATVDAGDVTAVAESGQAGITATVGDSSATVVVSATAAVLDNLHITPSNAVVANGLTTQLTATGTFSDGHSTDFSSLVSWSSSASGTATVSSTGLVTGKAVGSATITVSAVSSDGTTIAASSTVNVTPALLSSITVSPSSPTIAAGTSLRFTATGHYTDGSSQNITSLVTWASDSAVASISNTVGTVGLALGNSAGSATISATLSGVSAQATLTVSAATLVSIELAPSAPVLANGTTAQLSATGTYSNGSTVNLTSQVTWSVSGTAFTISPAGLLRAVDVGAGTVTAQLSGLSASVPATATDATLVSISVSPASSVIAKGTTVQLAAVGSYSDGSSQNLTSVVDWTTSDSNVATVSTDPASRGLVTGVATGSASLIATFAGVSGEASVSVSSATLTSIAVTPLSPAFAKGTKKSFSATGTYSDNSALDLTAQVIWSTSDATIADVSNDPGAQGEVTANATGSATITATLGTVSGTATANVTAATLSSLSVSPATKQIANGTSFQFTATGLYSDNSSQDLTSSATWTSSDGNVATISNSGARGLAHGVAVGNVTVTATFGGASATASLAVSSATLSSIAVSPAAPVLANGTSVQLHAFGTYSDNSVQELTGQVTWTSSTGATVFSATTAGLLQAASVGTSTLTAALSGVSGVATVTVTDATLLALEISPAAPTLASGTSLHLAVTGTYSDGSTQDVTSLVAWASSAQAIASVSNATGSRGLVTAGSQGTATISATLSGITTSTDVTVSNAVLSSIELTPSTGVLPKGTTLAFTATGTYSDGSHQELTTQVTWSTGDASIAAVSSAPGSEGVVSALAVGQTSLTAAFGSIAISTQVTVTAPLLDSVVVSPAVSSIAAGTSITLTATGIYTDGSSQDLTSSVTFSSDNTDVATVSNDPASHGVVRGEGSGDAIITAAFGGKSGTARISVTAAVLTSLQITPPSPVLANGTSLQLTATGTFSDGTSQDLTAQAVWASDTTAFAFSGTTPGLLLAQAEGTATLTATVDAITGSTVGTVTTATLTSITISPTDPTIAKGTTVQLSATGTYSDGSSQDLSSVVTWSTSDDTVATVSNATGTRGVVTGVLAGTASITATLGAVTDSVTVTVTGATLESLAVSPPSPVLAKGTTQALVATGTYSDGSEQDLTAEVTWSTSDDTVAAVSNAAGSQGLVSGVSAGSAQITATFGAFSATASVTITNASLLTIDVTPASPTIAKGTTQQYFATGTYSDGSTQDLTSTVTWSTSDTAVATISNATGTRGLATGSAVGSVTVTATFSNVSGTASLTVSSAALTSISVTPATSTVAQGQAEQLVATGLYSDGSTQDVTALATWSSSSTTVATVSNTTGSKGLVTGRATGNTTITATFDSKFGTALVTVSTVSLSSIQVTPPTARLAVNATLALKATGTYSNTTTQDLTTVATWTSSNINVATVSSTGVVTAKGAGTATISAAFGGRTGTSSITVTTATLSSVVVTPAVKTLAGGIAFQYKATGVYSDNSTLDVTSVATWTSSDESVATVSSTGVVTTIGGGAATISATYASLTGNANVTVSGASLTGVVVTQPIVKIARTTTATLKATATFSDGTTLDVTSAATWATSDGAIATVSSTGVVTGVAAGAATITATWSGTSGSSAVTVTSATISSISVTAVVGTSYTVPRYYYKQLKATATLSDATTQDVTELATWTSANNARVTVSNVAGSKGLVYGVASSTFISTNVTATVGAVNGRRGIRVSSATLSSITIAAVTGSSLTVPAGFASRLTATGRFSDNSTADLSSQVTWTTSNSAVATATSSAGVISAVSAGTATVRAAVGTTTGSATMTVSSATLSSIAVTTTGGATSGSVAVGATLAVKATGTFSDGSTLDISGESFWTSASPANATVAGGFPASVMGVASSPGVAITATAASGVAGAMTVTVP